MNQQNLFYKIYKAIMGSAFPNFETLLESAVGDAQTLLDVGCGTNSPIQYFSHRLHATGIDLSENAIEASRKKGIHKEYLLVNALELDAVFQPKSFDCVIATDLIEHLEKPDGYRLLDSLERIARKKVIIYTPNGFLKQVPEEVAKNKYQEHRSGWTPEEFVSRGYGVVGIHGLRSLRGETVNLRFKPWFFWQIISILSRPYVLHRPQKALEILCTKNIQDTSKNSNNGSLQQRSG